MTLINDSLLKQALNRNSEEAYTEEDLLKVVQLLMDLGFDKGDTKAVFQELEEQEIKLYGQKRSKADILAEIKEANRTIARLKSEEAERDAKIARLKSEEAERDAKIARLKSEEAERDVRIACLKSEKAELDAKIARLKSEEVELDTKTAECGRKIERAKAKREFDL